jgi:hypothetical protein
MGKAYSMYGSTEVRAEFLVMEPEERRAVKRLRHKWENDTKLVCLMWSSLK